MILNCFKDYEIRKLKEDIVSINDLQSKMSEELDALDTDQKELDAKMKRLEADFKIKGNSSVTNSLDKRIDELEDKHNKLSEQVVTEQIKTRYSWILDRFGSNKFKLNYFHYVWRMQVEEIKDEIDELDKKFSKIKEVKNYLALIIENPILKIFII